MRTTDECENQMLARDSELPERKLIDISVLPYEFKVMEIIWEPVELCMACALAVELASLPRERVCVPEAACDTPAAAVGDTEARGESLLTEALGVALLPREGVGGAEALKVAV